MQHFKFVNWCIRGFIFLMSRTGFILNNGSNSDFYQNKSTRSFINPFRPPTAITMFGWIEWSRKTLKILKNRGRRWIRGFIKSLISKVTSMYYVNTCKGGGGLENGNYCFFSRHKICLCRVVWPNFCRTLLHILQGLPLG